MCPVFQVSRAFRASLDEGGLISVTLEHSDLRDNVTAYAAQLTGEPRAALATFANASGGRVTFRASLHGAIYSVGLLLQQEGGQGWSTPVHTLTLLTSKFTQPLFLTFCLIHSLLLLYLFVSLTSSLSPVQSFSHFFSLTPISHLTLFPHLTFSLKIPMLLTLYHSLTLS